MNSWTIAYQYNTMTFVAAEQQEAILRGKATADDTLDDEDLMLCFRKLVEQGDACGGHHVCVICRRGLRRVVRYCMEHYIYIRAAGGVVQEPDGCQLLIFRNGRWDLPKGGVEGGETLQQAAIREVNEETAMHDLTCGALIIKTYHIYNLYGGWHLKQTSWFRMAVPSTYPITVQQEEGITAGDWVSPDELQRRLAHSYATLRQVAKKMASGS